MKLESERTLVTVANAICLVTSTIKEIAGDEIAYKIAGNPVSDETYAALISSEFNKDLIATRLPGA